MAPQDRKQQLIERRDELQARLKAIKKDYGRGLDADFEEQAVQLENAEVLSEIARIATEELAQVEQQLAELNQKSLG